MSYLVVDASVVVKWFVPEIHSADAVRLLSGRHEFIAPDLLFAEVTNTIWKKAQRRELAPTLARRLVGDVIGIAVEAVPCRTLAVDALALAQSVGITVYDAIYLVLAVRMDSRLVTADQRLHGAVAAFPQLAERVRLPSDMA